MATPVTSKPAIPLTWNKLAVHQSFLSTQLFLTKAPSKTLFFLDIVGVGLALGTSYYLRMDHFSTEIFFSWRVLTIIVATFTVFHILDLYKFTPQTSTLRAPGRVLLAVAGAGLLVVFSTYLIGGGSKLSSEAGRGILLVHLALFSVWASAWRYLTLKLIRQHAKKTSWLVLGTPGILQKFAGDFAENLGQGDLSFLVPESEVAQIQGAGSNFELAGTWERVEDWLTKKHWSGVLVADSAKIPTKVLNSLMHSRFTGNRVLTLTEFYQKMWFKIPVFCLEDQWFTLSSGFALLHNPIGLRVKRLIDLTLSLVLLLLTLPIMMIAAVVVKLTSKGPAIYRQIRTGLNGQTFTIYKFRSMIVDAEKNGAQWSTKNDSRITFVGRIMRATRIDELPQLINVLEGSMSFIGPRPERPEFNDQLEQQIPYYHQRHLVRPGITGWAQVQFRYGSSENDSMEKLQYDLYYIKNYSLMLDFAILIRTINVVVFGKGR